MFTQKGDKLFFEAIVQSVRTLKDRSASITLHTQEIARGQGSLLLDLNQCFVKVIIAEVDDEVTKDDLEDLEDFKPDKFDIPKDKSPSKRLRDTLFIKWVKLGKPGGESNYDAWYIQRIEEYILHEKKQIDKLGA